MMLLNWYSTGIDQPVTVLKVGIFCKPYIAECMALIVVFDSISIFLRSAADEFKVLKGQLTKLAI